MTDLQFQEDTVLVDWHSVFFLLLQVKSVELSPHTDYQLKAVVQMENFGDLEMWELHPVP